MMENLHSEMNSHSLWEQWSKSVEAHVHFAPPALVHIYIIAVILLDDNHLCGKMIREVLSDVLLCLPGFIVSSVKM